MLLESIFNTKRDKLVVITEQGRNVQKLKARHFQIIEKQMEENIRQENLELLKQLLDENLQRKQGVKE